MGFSGAVKNPTGRDWRTWLLGRTAFLFGSGNKRFVRIRHPLSFVYLSFKRVHEMLMILPSNLLRYGVPVLIRYLSRASMISLRTQGIACMRSSFRTDWIYSCRKGFKVIAFPDLLGRPEIIQSYQVHHQAFDEPTLPSQV